jgi:hypothetical protein
MDDKVVAAWNAAVARGKAEPERKSRSKTYRRNEDNPELLRRRWDSLRKAILETFGDLAEGQLPESCPSDFEGNDFVFHLRHPVHGRVALCTRWLVKNEGWRQVQDVRDGRPFAVAVEFDGAGKPTRWIGVDSLSKAVAKCDGIAR